ncbi:MAG TPA: hypothetical protein PLS53_09420 [Thermoanaerobaculaceae bacterium]|nr:hypothetical protein [Thermoanaerobaculaceae bacterium]HPS78363.1 hypothetical protein [Thermoanaerobaculaceae bacterium]
MSEETPIDPFGPGGPGLPADNAPYQPPQVLFTQPVEFVAGTCGKADLFTCASTANPIAS